MELFLILILILILNGIREAMRPALPVALRQAWPSHRFFAAALACFERFSKISRDFSYSCRQRG